jgi:hypothetical protein
MPDRRKHMNKLKLLTIGVFSAFALSSFLAAGGGTGAQTKPAGILGTVAGYKGWQHVSERVKESHLTEALSLSVGG